MNCTFLTLLYKMNDIKLIIYHEIWLSWVTYFKERTCIGLDLGSTWERPQYLRNTNAFISFNHIFHKIIGFDPPIFLTSIRQCIHVLSTTSKCSILKNLHVHVHTAQLHSFLLYTANYQPLRIIKMLAVHSFGTPAIQRRYLAL